MQKVFWVWSGLEKRHFECPIFSPVFCSASIDQESDITADDDVQQAAITFSQQLGNWPWNHVSMYDRRLLFILFCKHLRCTYSIVYRLIICSIVLTIRQKNPNKSLDIMSAFVAERVWHLFSASGRMRRDWCEVERIKHSSWQYWMWRAFRSPVRSEINSEQLQWEISFIKPHYARAGPKPDDNDVMFITGDDFTT